MYITSQTVNHSSQMHKFVHIKDQNVNYFQFSYIYDELCASSYALHKNIGIYVPYSFQQKMERS